MIKLVQSLSINNEFIVCLQLKYKLMIQLERVKLIYSFLENEPLTVNQIYLILQAKKVEVKQRQIYNDLVQLKQFYLRSEEQLTYTTGLYNRKVYRLIKPSMGINLTQNDIATFQIIRSASPRGLNIGRSASMNKFRFVYKDLIKTNKAFYSFMLEDQNIRTNFYESLYDHDYNKVVDDMIWAIANFKIIFIQKLYGDATSAAHLTNAPFRFKPLYFIFHRGNHFLAGFTESDHVFLVLDISKIENVELTQKTFAYKKLLQAGKMELDKRFGVTNNINNLTYTIILEFTDTTGEFVKHYFWHTSQKMTLLKSGNWLMEMECGINRELLGWIFQWMGNVRIQSPKKLVDLYLSHVKDINENYQKEIDIKYKNHFITKSV